MKHDQETYERIEQYLAGALEGEALATFESEMESDEEFQNEVALQRNVQELLGDVEVQNLDNTLSEFRKEYEESKVVKMFPFRRVGLVAAAIIGLAIVYLGFFRNQQLTSTELYEAYFEPYPADVSSRAGIDSLSLSTMEIALKAYDNGRYEEAYELLNTLPQTDKRVRFYMGVCQLSLDKPSLALYFFLEVSKDEQSVYKDPANWYIALLSLKIGKEKAARGYLNELSRTASGKYQKLASDLLEAME